MRLTLTYRFLPRLSAGIEWNPKADDVSPLLNWLALEESDLRPALIAGVSSDRIGTPDGEAYYLTASKNLTRGKAIPVAPYLGAAYGTYEDRWRMIGGLNVGFRNWLDGLVVYDGVNTHAMLMFSYRNHTGTILLVDLEDLGVAYSVAF